MFSFQGTVLVIKTRYQHSILQMLISSFKREHGGDKRNRTADLLLARQALSQLSYAPIFLFKEWWAKVDSNHRPHDYQSCALAS